MTASPQVADTSVSGGQGTDNAEFGSSIPSFFCGRMSCARQRTGIAGLKRAIGGVVWATQR